MDNINNNNYNMLQYINRRKLNGSINCTMVNMVTTRFTKVNSRTNKTIRKQKKYKLNTITKG